MTAQKTILIVDDNEELCVALAATLRGAGYSVRTHTNAEAAFDELRGYLPNMVICDRRMPGMSGDRFIDAMKSIPLYAKVPILVMSGALPSDIGWVIYIEKPFGDETLLDVVKKFAR